MAVIQSVGSITNRIDYDPNGIQTVFPFDFEVDNADWMLVYADGVLYESNPFTVSGIGVPAGGSVTFQDPPEDAIVTLTLIREVPMTQEIVYPVYGPFPAKTHEKALDKLTWMAQQQQEELDRAFKAPIDGELGEIFIPATRVTLIPPTHIADDTVQEWIDEADTNLYDQSFAAGVSFADAATVVKGVTVQAFNQNMDTKVDSQSSADGISFDDAATAIKGATVQAWNVAVDTLFGTYGDVVTHDVVVDADDVTATRVLVVGYKGLGTTGALLIPTGDTSQRPIAPVEGQYRRNSETGQWEGYTGVFWGPLGGGAAGGGSNQVFYENDTNVTGDYTITTGKNAMSAGPITVDNGVTVTVPDGSVWSVV